MGDDPPGLEDLDASQVNLLAAVGSQKESAADGQLPHPSLHLKHRAALVLALALVQSLSSCFWRGHLTQAKAYKCTAK